MIAIIGSGPAGVSAALYLARANKDVLVFTNHQSSLLKAKKVENYYGTGIISGNELYQEGLLELKNLNITIIEEEVFDITFENKFILETNNNHYEVDAIVLATGSSKSQPKINNLNKFEGNGVSYCATCDGFFFKNKKIAVIGNSSFAIHELNYLANITDSLYLLTNGKDNIKSKYKTITKKIKSVVGKSHLEQIIFADDSKIDIDVIFVAEEFPDSNILAKKCGILTDKNGIVINDKQETNIPGIYACGDATPGVKQIAKAVYEGMNAANSAIDYINNKIKM